MRRTTIIAIVTTVLVPVVTAPNASAARAPYAPHLDRKIVPTRTTSLGQQLATWYGPGLFGNGTACGQQLTPQTWGIAHRTLPCGTLVTLTHKGRTVAVRVIDRGPYSGATIDLTAKTKRFLRFTAGTVRMVKVHKFRMLPKPKPVSGIVALTP